MSKMYNKTWFKVSICFFILCINVFATDEENKTNMPATSIPVLEQFISNKADTLEGHYYHEIVTLETAKKCSGAASCAEGLKETVSFKTKDGFMFDPEQERGYVKFNGFDKMVLNIPERSRIDTKILIFWTLRVEAAKEQQPLDITKFCSSWCGQSQQKIKGGQVYARLFVDGKPKGEYGALTMPDFGEISFEKQPPAPPRVLDPTISGSVLLVPADFGGRFPETLTLELRWFNDTSMKVISAKEEAQIVVKMIPGEQPEA
ncbi:MAG: hypothetical protein N2606_01455 [Candidatus Omnitrophica bacterium]|nr:hypothetical protein [Candidatus Omnitrophota bacterium]